MLLNLMGRRWRFRRVGNLSNFGDCDHPATRGKEIRIRANQAPRDELDTIIHEITHACNFDLSEDFVTQFANSLSAALWRLGYRKCE